MARAVVLLSGGLDSATTLAIARAEGRECHCLTVDYGQRHRAELAAAARVARALGAAEHRVVALDLTQFGGSALTDRAIAVPAGAGDGDTGHLRSRAQHDLSLARARLGGGAAAQDICFGANAVDYSGYPDCRPEYMRAFEALANLATKAAVEGRRLTLHTPIIDLAQGGDHPARRGARRGLRADGVVLPGDARWPRVRAAATRAGCGAPVSRPRASPTPPATRTDGRYMTDVTRVRSDPDLAANSAMELTIHHGVLVAVFAIAARHGRGHGEDALLHHGRGLRLGQHRRHGPHARVGVLDGGRARRRARARGDGHGRSLADTFPAVPHRQLRAGCATSWAGSCSASA